MAGGEGCMDVRATAEWHEMCQVAWLNPQHAIHTSTPQKQTKKKIRR